MVPGVPAISKDESARLEYRSAETRPRHCPTSSWLSDMVINGGGRSSMLKHDSLTRALPFIHQSSKRDVTREGAKDLSVFTFLNHSQYQHTPRCTTATTFTVSLRVLSFQQWRLVNSLQVAIQLHLIARAFVFKTTAPEFCILEHCLRRRLSTAKRLVLVLRCHRHLLTSITFTMLPLLSAPLLALLAQAHLQLDGATSLAIRNSRTISRSCAI